MSEPGARHSHDLQAFSHSHAFADDGQRQRERALGAVTLLTLITMAVELGVGWWTASLALTADGWHMGTHALALGGAVLAYRLSQRAASRRARDGGPAGYAFGGWKIEVLTAYTSGLVLLGVAAWLGWEGVQTLRFPHPVAYADALVIAVVGLAVNLASVWLLARGGGGGHAHGHASGGGHGGSHGHSQRHSHGPAHGQSHGHSGGHPHGQTHGQAHGHGGAGGSAAAHGHAGEGHGPGDSDRRHHRGHEQGRRHRHDGHGHHPGPAPADSEHREPGHRGRAQPAQAEPAARQSVAAPAPRRRAGGPHDHNFSAAYVHVLADAFTSVLAIAALAGGAWFGLAWLDPAVALLGAAVIGRWSLGVLGHSARALVDATEDPALTQRIRDLIEGDGDAKVADLHVWQVGAQAWSAALSVVADSPLPAATYRDRLRAVEPLRHATVEVHRCPGPSPG